MVMEQASKMDLESIFQMYREATESEFCVWNEFYPGEEELQMDFTTGNLYVLRDRAEIFGAISIVPENELDESEGWKVTDASVREIARVVIARKHQGKGLAYQMMEFVTQLLKDDGCKAVHLSVVDKNVPAFKTYKKLGFEVVGEEEMYGGHYFLCEKVL